MSELGPADVISEIRLLLNEPRHIHTTFIVLEGDSDRKLFKGLLHESATVLKPHNSKNGLESIVIEHFKRKARVIGIRDKDYVFKKSRSPRIFYCDYCCAEMMIISMDACMNKLYSEYYIGEWTYSDLRCYILKKLRFFSLCRKYNELYRWGINFKGITPNGCFDEDDYKMGNNFVSKINKQNPKNLLSNNRLADINNDATDGYCDLLNITNGHDFVNLFVELCNKPNNRNVSEKNVESAMRCSLSIAEFAQTTLYQGLANYQSKYQLNILR